MYAHTCASLSYNCIVPRWPDNEVEEALDQGIQQISDENTDEEGEVNSVTIKRHSYEFALYWEHLLIDEHDECMV